MEEMDFHEIEVCCCARYNPSKFTGSTSQIKRQHDTIAPNFCRRFSHLLLHMKGICIFPGSAR